MLNFSTGIGCSPNIRAAFRPGSRRMPESMHRPILSLRSALPHEPPDLGDERDQRTTLRNGRLRMPEVDEQACSWADARVARLVLEGVVEQQTPPLLPGA